MHITTNHADRSAEFIGLFTSTFTQSEGADEGALIGNLVSEMLGTVDPADRLVVSALDGDEVIGSVIFTRMRYPEDARVVFILSPMAVAPDRQGQGVGQRLLREGFDLLRDRGVDVVLTYGDINFYGRAGFAQIAEATARAPLPLSFPDRWLGRSLTDAPLDPLKGPSSCVAPLSRPEI